MPNSAIQKNNMYTGSEDLEDMVKGYLRSGKVLENKLQKISSIKHAIKSVEQLPQKEDINEFPEDEDEESRAINVS